MDSPRHSTYVPVVALLLALAFLSGLIVLASPGLRIPEPAFISTVSARLQQMGYRQAVATGVIGLLLLALIGYFVRRVLRSWLAKRQKAREAEIQPETLVLAYRHKLMAQLSQLKVMDVADSFDLETSYIPLRVRVEEGGEAVSSSGYSPQVKGEGRVMSLREALARFRHLALLGEPGAGKTTLLRHLAFQAAASASRREETEERDLPDFPVLISLSHFAAAASQTSLLDFIIREIDAFYGSPALRSYLEERLEEGSVLLLLDGLDGTNIGHPQEAEATYRRVVGQINVLTARYPRVPVVVTSRWAGWKGLLASSFRTLEILELEEDDVQRFLVKWFGRNSERARELQRIISRDHWVRALVANPLLLSLVAFVFEQDGELPEGRAGLYKRGTELLLEKWETHRGRKRVSRFTAEHQRELLEEVALHFHLRRLLCFPEDDLSGITAGCLSAVGLPTDWVPNALGRLGDQYGLLKEWAPGWYGFPHLTWQEYFAAVAIGKRGQLELALEGVPDPWWEGTILFLAGMLDDATPLLEGIMSREDDIFRSNLMLAGRCLANKPRLKRTELRESIIAQLQELVEGKVHLPLRQQAIRVLAKIDDPSITAYFQSLVTTGKVDSTVHRWVTAALASLGDESTITDLVALLSDQEIDFAVRANIAAALGSLGNQSLIPQFLDLLSDEEVDYRVRMAVAEALGVLGARSESGRKDESVVPQLLRLLPNEKVDYRVRVRVAEALSVLGACSKRGRRDGAITSKLLRLLRNEKVDYSVRMAVAETLGASGDASISNQLLAILLKKKIDPDVRASIAGALGPLGDKSVIPQLLRLLPNEKIDPSIRWKIVDSLTVLGAMDDEATAPELLSLLSNEKVDSSVRVTVAEAMGEKTVTPHLPTPIPVGREAAEVLRSLGDRSKVSQFLTLLSDRKLDRSVRLKIVEALGDLGDDRSTAEGLATLLDDEELGPDVYRALYRVSQRIGVRVFARNGGGYELR